MNNKFILVFSKELTKLSGNTFGKTVFNEQVRDSINYGQKIVLVFPERIDYIGTSFIQGFFEEIFQNIGISGIKNNLTIETSIDGFIDYVVNNLE